MDTGPCPFINKACYLATISVRLEVLEYLGTDTCSLVSAMMIIRTVYIGTLGVAQFLC